MPARKSQQGDSGRPVIVVSNRLPFTFHRGSRGLERRRRQLGSNSATVEADEINKAQIQDFSDFLIGRAEGVIMNDVSGDVGTSQRIRIRGSASISLSNEPLIMARPCSLTAPRGKALPGVYLMSTWTSTPF